MKTRQDQIDEMTKLIQAEYEQWLDTMGVIPKASTYYAECMGCAIDSAEILYNAGYRKTFTSEFASDTQKAFKEGYIKGCIDQMGNNYAIQKERICKQAKIDVLNELKKYLHTEDFDTPDERWKPESDFCAIIDELIKGVQNDSL